MVVTVKHPSVECLPILKRKPGLKLLTPICSGKVPNLHSSVTSRADTKTVPTSSTNVNLLATRHNSDLSR